ncbi:MAG: hypothetical protein J0H69_20255 [Burkholderiales bacterium]|nr:hypothetical protein [Burkholderiales bacterium]
MLEAIYEDAICGHRSFELMLWLEDDRWHSAWRAAGEKHWRGVSGSRTTREAARAAAQACCVRYGHRNRRRTPQPEPPLLAAGATSGSDMWSQTFEALQSTRLQLAQSTDEDERRRLAAEVEKLGGAVDRLAASLLGSRNRSGPRPRTRPVQPS